MAAITDDLIEYLLDVISLSRSKGYTALDFEEAVHSFYERKNAEVATEDQIIVDEPLIEAAFQRLSEHDDVEVQDDDQTAADEQDSQLTALRSNLTGKRIFTSEERLWLTITGHESDVTRVPGMEFELLVVIAQHGPQGCLQSTVTQITGQDKHSVPARTDKLAKKGYITKASVTAKQTRTSLLRLAKWAPSGPAPVIEGGMLSYDALFDTTMALLKENGNIISIDDLYKGLDPKGKTNRKILLRCCQRLSQAGCTRLLRCRVQDEDGNPVMLKHGKEEKTVNAMQLLRDPTTTDRAIWVNFRSKVGVSRARRKPARRERDSGEDDVDSEESVEDEDEDAEGETDDEAMEPRSRRGTVSSMPPPSSSSPVTPSRKSNRARRKSSLAQGADYARLFENDEIDSDQDAELDATESASPEAARRPVPKTATRTSTLRKKQARSRKVPNEDGSVRRRRERPQKTNRGSDRLEEENAGISTFETTPIRASAAVIGIISSAEPLTSSKRQRKKSTKALEAEALRAAGEPLLTEPVEYLDSQSDGSAEEGLVDVESDATEDDEPDMTTTAQTPDARGRPKKGRGPYKKRDSAKKDKSTSKKREPIVKKREIPPEEYEEYDIYAQATAERQVRIEMKTGTKRTATMAQLDKVAEGSNKAPRIETQDDTEEIGEDADLLTVELPADRVAEVKASILAREKPGAYINPPGARNTKLENYVQRGRPRNAIIAVIKSDGLKAFSWFKNEDGPRFAPKASRRRTARIGEGLAIFGEDKSLFFVEGSGSEGEGEGRNRKKRKFGEGQGRFRIEMRENMPIPQAGTPGTFGVLGLGLDGAADGDIARNDADTRGESFLQSRPLIRTSQISRRPSTGFNLAPIGSDWSATPDTIEGAVMGDNEEQAISTSLDPISAAKMEMAALQRKKGRTRKEDAIRIRVLERQIETDAAARQTEPEDSADASVDVEAGSEGSAAQQEILPPEKVSEAEKALGRHPATLRADTGDVEATEEPGRHALQSNGDELSTAPSREEPGATVLQIATVERQTIANGQSSVSATAAHNSPSALAGVEDGGLQTPQHTMMLSVKAPQVFLGGLDTSTTTLPSFQEESVATAQAGGSIVPPAQAALSSIKPALAQSGSASLLAQQTEMVSQLPSAHPGLVANKQGSYPELFSKQYIIEHPEEKFHYRGGGRYARGERFNRAYVEKHPNERFYRVYGEGNKVTFARGDDLGERASGGTGFSSPAIDPRISQSGFNSLDAITGAATQTQPWIGPEIAPPTFDTRDFNSGVTEQTQPISEHEMPSMAVAEQRTTSISKDKPQPAIEVDSSGPSQDKVVSSNSQAALPNQLSQPEELPDLIVQDSASFSTGLQQREIAPETPATPAAEKAAVSNGTERTPPKVDKDIPATLQDSVPTDSGRPQRNRGKAHEKENEPKVNAKKNDKWRETRALDTEERFQKAYVQAHPDEHFYHRGKGWYSRGEAVTKEYANEHPEEIFKIVANRYIRLPDADSRRESTPPPEVEPTEPINQELQSASSFNGLYDMYSKEYVEAHPHETFYHRGGGKWHPGLPPPGSKRGTGVRGPGAELWKRDAAKAADAALVAKAKLSFPTEASTKSSAVNPTVPAAETPSPFGKAAPISSLLTIYRPYSPQIIQKEAVSISTPVAATENGKRISRTTEINGTAVFEQDDVEMTEGAEEHDDLEGEPASSPTMDDGVNMNADSVMIGDDEYEDENYAPPAQGDDVGDDIFIPLDGPEDDERDDHTLEPTRTSLGQQTPSSNWRVFFPVDLTAAVVVRRSDKEKQQLAKSATKRRARLQTVTKPDDEDLIDLTISDSAQVAAKAAPPARKLTKTPRTPARGSKISRDMRLKAQRAWPYGVAPMVAIPAPILALVMHPLQTYQPETGTFGTFPAAAEIVLPSEQQDDRRALRPRTSLAKLPPALEEDFIETPGLIVKLKIKNLASVLPPDTAFESGLFATNAASDAVPVSKITGKPRRPYNKRSKRVTFDIVDSDGDEFRDDGEVEDEDMDEDSDEPEISDEDNPAVARPERRKRSTGVNGELRFRDMASGPAFRDADRLVVAFALVSAICGGLRVEGINWTLIAHALGFRYDGGFLRRRWDHFKRSRKVDVDRLREAIHEPFLEAYEDDDFPRVDFQNLNNTDWPALFDWVQATIVPYVRLQPEAEGPQVPDLPHSREELEEQFEIKENANLYESRLDEYFATGTEQNRRSLITRYTYGYALPGELRPKDQISQDMTLLRSWVRAVAVTKQYNYHPEAAAQKLRKFSPEMLQRVTAEMIDSRTFSQERKSRMLPGRNYQISNECLQGFRRWPPRPDECRFLRFVAQAWKNINSHFQSHDQLSLVPSASDPEYLVLTNMSAQGMIRISTIYPEIKEDYDAPFPKLSPWGYCGPTYETKKVDMTRLKFPIVYTKTAAYRDDHTLLNHVPIPLYPPQVEGEVGVRLPFWVDIHGNLIDDVWDMVLRSILHLLVFRSGSTAIMIEQAHGRKLWTWEIEMALEWMREVGIAERVGAGYVTEDGVWDGGWRAGEWWYCAFAPEVARWKAPAVAE